MFNIQPGQGLGFSGSRQIALGLGSLYFLEGLIIIVETDLDQISRIYITESIVTVWDLESLTVEHKIKSAIKYEIESVTINHLK